MSYDEFCFSIIWNLGDVSSDSINDIWVVGKTEHIVSKNIEGTTFLLDALGLSFIRKTLFCTRH